MRHSVVRQHWDSWVDPGAVFSALYADWPDCFWLDSGIHAVTGMSYLGIGSRVATASVAEGTVRCEPDGLVFRGTVFEFLASESAGVDGTGARRLSPGDEQSAAAQQLTSSGWSGGFQLGWVGWLGYELRHQTRDSRSSEDSEPGYRSLPHGHDGALLFADRVIAFDHANRKLILMALGERWDGSAQRWRDETVAHLESLLLSPRPADAPSPVAAAPALPLTVRWRDTDEEYLGMVRACQDQIRDGNAYQLCLTTQAEVDAHPDPAIAYSMLRQSSPSHHGGFLRIGGLCLLSSSPERFLSVSADGWIESRPIKGTRRRGATAAEDARLLTELETSAKERAENLMIVDLMRNDIARVSEVGSVGVPSLLRVESYAQVHQLVSTVRGRLRSGSSGIDALTACFPAGSMTGAPKLRATEILHRLERRPRGIYSGAFGFFSLDGSLDLAMVIRSIVLDGDGATIGSGGGITALSVPEEELEEVRLKAAALLAVLLAAPPAPLCSRTFPAQNEGVPGRRAAEG